MLTERESNLIETFRKRMPPRSELIAERLKARQSGKIELEDAILALIDERNESEKASQPTLDLRETQNQLNRIGKSHLAHTISKSPNLCSAPVSMHTTDYAAIIEKFSKPVSESNEYIYILSNESMPGLIKVGKTKTNPMQRRDELHSTGVPTPFVIEFSARVFDCNYAEKMAHRALGKYRVSKGREFFKITATEALIKILPAIGDYHIAFCANSTNVIDAEEALVRKAESEQLWREENRKKIERESLRKLQKEASACKAARAPIFEALIVEQRKLEELGPRPRKTFTTVLFPCMAAIFGIAGMFSLVLTFWSIGSKLSTLNMLGYTVVFFLHAWMFEEFDPKTYRKAMAPFIEIDSRIRILKIKLDEYEMELRHRLPTAYEDYSLDELLELSNSNIHNYK